MLAVAGTTTPIDAALAEKLLPVLKVAVEVAAEQDAAIVTGGTDAGVLHLLGLALSSAPRRPRVVVGVAPDALLAPTGPDASAVVTPEAAAGAESAPSSEDEPARVDPQLTALVRVPGAAWGDETSALSEIVARIAGEQPAVALLAGGGDGSRAEVVEHLSRGRAVVVLAGSGRLADELAGPAAIDDVDLTALRATGDVHVARLDESVATFGRDLEWLLARRRGRSLRDRAPLLFVMPKVRVDAGQPDSPLPARAPALFPALGPRIDDVEAVVMPAFGACDVEARQEQNRHRWFTLLAILGGLLTTTAGAAQAWLQSVAWPGIAVATLGAATSALITVSRRQDSLRRYLSARIRCRAPALAVLRVPGAAARARRPRAAQAAPKAGGTGGRAPARAGVAVTDGWRDEVIDVYRRYRIDDQARYYERRAADFERARRWTVTITALLLVLAALFGSLGAADADRRAAWAFVAAALAALATALTTLESSFGFERFARQYGETRAALAVAAVRGPCADEPDAAGDGTDVQTFVTEVERILRSEVDTWSQQATAPPNGGSPPSSET